MTRTHDHTASGDTPDRQASSAGDLDIADVLFTLEICRRALPVETHPVHFDRLRWITDVVRSSLEQRSHDGSAGGHLPTTPPQDRRI